MIPISLTAAEFICLNLRPIDHAEVFGLRAHDNPLLLAKEVVLAASHGKAAIATHKGKPCGVIGVSPLWPGVWTAWSFGTEEWPKAVLEMSRYGRQVLKPFILGCGAHRLQCESRVDHVEAHRWLEAMGARKEGLLCGYGRDGADYFMFSWSKS